MDMGGGARLFVASPSYSATYCHGYVESLVGLIKDCSANDIKTAYKAVTGVHWIDIARDILSHVFLHSDCTHMLQIDADVGFPADAARRLIRHDKDIIGGTYPIKSDLAEIYPHKRTGEAVDGLIPAELPGGFMLVKREVIEAMSTGEKYRCAALPFGEMRVSPLFTREMRSDGYTGEDFMFCRRAMACGFESWLDPNITLTHTGAKTWRGNYSEFLRGNDGNLHDAS